MFAFVPKIKIAQSHIADASALESIVVPNVYVITAKIEDLSEGKLIIYLRTFILNQK